jgi:anti-sigma factor RsiW
VLESLIQARPAACLSDLRLDAYLAEEVSAEEARTMQEHLAHCPRCQQRLGALTSTRTDYLAMPSASAFRSELKKRASGGLAAQRTRRVLALGSVLAASLAVLLLSLPRTEPERGAGTRLKSEERLGFFVKHAGRTRRGSDGEQVLPGDLLRFTYATTRTVQFAVLSYDAQKHASVYVPFMSAAPGVHVAAPLSVELDASLGVELLYGMFCEQRPVLSDLLRALEERAGVPPAVPGCEVVVLRIVKVSGD